MFNMLLRKSEGRKSFRMKRLSQSGNNAQLWTCVVVEVKSHAGKNQLAQEHGMLHSQIKINRVWSSGDDESEHQHFRN